MGTPVTTQPVKPIILDLLQQGQRASAAFVQALGEADLMDAHRFRVIAEDRPL
jgi:hypothetical protein